MKLPWDVGCFEHYIKVFPVTLVLVSVLAQVKVIACVGLPYVSDQQHISTNKFIKAKLGVSIIDDVHYLT